MDSPVDRAFGVGAANDRCAEASLVLSVLDDCPIVLRALRPPWWGISVAATPSLRQLCGVPHGLMRCLVAPCYFCRGISRDSQHKRRNTGSLLHVALPRVLAAWWHALSHQPWHTVIMHLRVVNDSPSSTMPLTCAAPRWSCGCRSAQLAAAVASSLLLFVSRVYSTS